MSEDVTDLNPARGLEGLAEANPWPHSKPDAPTSSWGWGIDGDELLRSSIARDAAVIVEIGSLLGGSARFFAELCPSAHLICIDPWFDVDDPADRPFLAHAPELADFVMSETDGIHQIFLASNWELRHRVTPLRGYSPDPLITVHDHGVVPDVVYIDGSHVYEDVLADLFTTRLLFPDTVVCGDDWNWPAVQRAVEYLARNRGDVVRNLGNTWVIERGATAGRYPAASAVTVGPVERSVAGRAMQRLLDVRTGRSPAR
ncbi:MAG: class I SAM-dependent methyltransferase [Acidimicrobiales bacterium]